MRFWKMHGLGNDYIVIDNRDERISGKQAADLAKRLCERRFSVGADGLLLVSNSKVADAKMRIFNADGSEAEMCGNGIRCFAKYCYENSIVPKQEFMVETLSGLKHVWLTLKGQRSHGCQGRYGCAKLAKKLPSHGWARHMHQRKLKC